MSQRNRAILVVLFSLVAAVTGYWICYSVSTMPAKEMMAEPQGELEWLRCEFNLTDSQFKKIKALHEEYSPKCGIMCQKIAEANDRLESLMRKANGMTPEIEAALRECSNVQLSCHQALLTHVYAVAKEMSPESGKRYLDMMEPQFVQSGMPADSTISKH